MEKIFKYFIILFLVLLTLIGFVGCVMIDETEINKYQQYEAQETIDNKINSDEIKNKETKDKKDHTGEYNYYMKPNGGIKSGINMSGDDGAGVYWTPGSAGNLGGGMSFGYGF